MQVLSGRILKGNSSQSATAASVSAGIELGVLKEVAISYQLPGIKYIHPLIQAFRAFGKQPAVGSFANSEREGAKNSKEAVVENTHIVESAAVEVFLDLC